MAQEKSTSSGTGFCSLLAIAFIILKLCNVIKWSWVWVLSPVWIPVSVALLACIIYVVFFSGNNLKTKTYKRTEPTKSRWQERMEQMQKSQTAHKN